MSLFIKLIKLIKKLNNKVNYFVLIIIKNNIYLMETPLTNLKSFILFDDSPKKYLFSFSSHLNIIISLFKKKYLFN